MDIQQACKLLGTTPSEDIDSAKKKYKKLVAKHHPDVNKEPNAEQVFKEINQAWEVFEESKNPKPSHFDMGGIEDLFRHMHQQTVTVAPEDVHLNVTLSFKESVTGTSKEFSYRRNRPCQTCRGDGRIPQNNGCTTCKGKGVIEQRSHNMFRTTTCTQCMGRMKSIPCSTCTSLGIQETESPINVKIPGGVVSGNTLRLSSMGNVAKSPIGLHASDAFVHIEVTPHEYLYLKDNSVVFDLHTSLLEALEGKTLSVPTIDGESNITIPPLSKNNQEFLLPNLGVNRTNSQKIILNVSYPDGIDLTRLLNALKEPHDDQLSE
jgi:molecular chaperone DnaJ